MQRHEKKSQFIRLQAPGDGGGDCDGEGGGDGEGVEPCNIC
jgi:hypothetical protein